MLKKASVAGIIKAVKEVTGKTIICDNVRRFDVILPSIKTNYIVDYLSGILGIDFVNVFQSDEYICAEHPDHDIFIMVNIEKTIGIKDLLLKYGYVSIVSNNVDIDTINTIAETILKDISIYNNKTLIMTGIIPSYSVTPFGVNLLFTTAVPINCIEQNYDKEIIDAYNEIVQAAKEGYVDSAKLVIMHGQPGTGKTVLSTAIATSLYTYGYILVTVSGASSPTSGYDEIVGLHDKFIFLADDSADMLKKSDISSKLLDIISDNSKHDHLFICTFNTISGAVNPAIVREGRLLKMMNVGLLDKSQAIKAARSIYGDIDVKVMTENGISLSSIYAAECVGDEVILDGETRVIDFERATKLKRIRNLGNIG